MRNFLKLCSLVSLFAVALVLFPPPLHAQWVYVNDNNANTGANTATGFMNIPTNKLLSIPGSPWATGGTGRGTSSALKNQALYTVGAPPNTPCLYISDPNASTSYPNGDIAAFQVNTGTGSLALVARYAPPAGSSGSSSGIALATGKATLYAGFTFSKTIAVWKITGANCTLTYSSLVTVMPLHGGHINGMSESLNQNTLVVTYDDGSIESFTTTGSGIAKTPCVTAINSTGYSDGNGGHPAGVDITRDSKYAIFGDQSSGAPTELETVELPITCSTVTTDFGGSIGASGINLGSGQDSEDVWLSPNEEFIYVANNSNGKVTTVDFTETPTPALALAGPCTAPFTNPTSLRPASWAIDAGIQTSTTTGTGTRLYVAEYGAPSSVALLAVNAAGCTREAPLSPFTDNNSNYSLYGFGLTSINAWPPRPF